MNDTRHALPVRTRRVPVAAAAMLALLLMPGSVSAEPLDAIAAVVNNEVISCYEIAQGEKEMAQQLRQIGQKQLPSSDVMSKRVLESRIVQKLQLQEARKLGLATDEESVDKTIAEIESNNGIPAGMLPKVLEAQGMDFSEYRRILGERLLINNLVNVAVRSKLQVGEESMREYYRRYLAGARPLREIRLAQIFISLPPEPTPEEVQKARSRADEVYHRLQRGEKFARMVALYSDAPDASQGGEMGWLGSGAISPQFASTTKLPVGGFSRPLRSTSGFHLIKVLDERWIEPERGESYDEVHARHILIKVPATADTATKAKIRHRAASLARELSGKSDEAFATRAKEASQGPSASNGGDLGWFKRGDMLPAFEEVAFKLKAGETSGVVESPFGLHVIRVVEKRHIDPNSFEAHQENIQQTLLNVEMQEQMPRWISSLKAKALVERRQCPKIAAFAGSGN